MFLTKIFKKLLQYFIKNSNQITLFPHPESEGVIESRQTEEIIEVLKDEGPYIQSVNISVSDTAKSHIRDWVYLINDEIDKLIKLKVSLITTKIRSFIETEAYLSLNKKLEEIKLASIVLKDARDHKQFLEKYKKLQEVLFIEKNDHDEKLEAYIEVLTFLNKIDKDSHLDFGLLDQINKIKDICDVLLIRLEQKINNQTIEF